MARRTYNLCIVGFGNVGKALVRLLHEKSGELEREHGIHWRITGIASRTLGWIASPEGLDPQQLPAANARDVREWLKLARAGVLFEATPLNRHTGQPAIDHLKAALESGAHAISANKGPIVYGYEELRALARRRGRKFLFESAVMDGVPIFSLFRESLPVANVRGFRGILNSTTNIVLAEMEAGLTLDQAVRKAQELGIAETDPSDDLDGWDAAVKVAALSTVILGQPLPLASVRREGISALSPEAVRKARQEGKPYKLICRAQREAAGVRASVAPEQVPLSDPMAHVSGSSSCVQFELDILPGLTLFEENPGLQTTAYGLLADLVHAVGQSRK